MRIILVTIAILIATYASADPITSDQIRVVDGDTIVANQRTYRLVGFDAPETGQRSKCNAERTRGHTAAIRLIELLDGAKSIDLTQVACSCPKGTEGTSRCNYK